MTTLLEGRRRDLIVLIARATEELLRIERMLTRSRAQSVVVAAAANDSESPELLAAARAADTKDVRAWCVENGLPRVNKATRLDYARAMAKRDEAS